MTPVQRVTRAGEKYGTLGGNRRSRIYGRLDCPSALRALAAGGPYARYRVFFVDEAEAVAAGFRPCAVCLPAEYNRWRAKAMATSRPDSTRNRPG
jgi:methylphosphotriester-DNA--protein-cysteine methyltransferase